MHAAATAAAAAPLTHMTSVPPAPPAPSAPSASSARPASPASPAHTFRALLKRSMRARQQRILALTALGAAALLWAALGAPLSAHVVLGALALVALVALPVLLARRAALIACTGVPPPAGARVSRLAHARAVLRTPGAGRMLALHAALSAVAVVVYAAASSAVYGAHSSTYALMRHVPAHGAAYINEPFLVCALGAAVLGSVHAAWTMLAIPGARLTLPPFDTRYARVPLYVHACDALATSTARALLTLCAWPLVVAAYAALRESLWTGVLHLTGIDTPVRRYVVPSFYVPWRPWHLLVTALPVVLLPLVLLASVHTLFDVYWTHPLRTIAGALRDPLTPLLGGLHDTHPFFSTHALIEWARLARESPTFRASVFDDVQRLHGRPAAFASMASAAIKALDALAPSEPPPSHKPTDPPPRDAHDARSARSARSAPARTVWHALAADAPSTARHEAPRRAAAAPASASASASASAAAPAARRASARVGTLGALGALVWRCIPSEAQHVLFPHTLHALFCAPAPALALDARVWMTAPRAYFAAAALEHIVLASLTEDTYGSVQRHVPALVDALAHAHARLDAVRGDAERIAVAADSEHVRDMAVWRRALAEAGTDAGAAFGPASAPFFAEMQCAWRAYAPVDAMLSHVARRVVDAFAMHTHTARPLTPQR